jgi:iron complex transport system ATP-binding protein
MSEGPMLQLSNVSAGYGSRLVLSEVSLQIVASERVGLLGPNGSGKTTLLRLLGGVLGPQAGKVLLKQRAMESWPPRDRARILAGVPQSQGTPVPIRVRDVVATGRLPHIGDWSALRKVDEDAVSDALAAVDMQDKSDRLIDELSAGERQRAWLAMALAQQPEILLLDEPTAHLDIHQAWHVMELLSAWADERKLTVIFSTHDLNLAAAFCSRVLLLKDRRVFADGPPSDVFTSEKLSKVFAHPLDIRITDGTPTVTPRRSAVMPKSGNAES